MAEVDDDIAKLGGLPRSALVERWIAYHGTAPSKGISRRLLELSAPWHLQCRMYGGPDRELRRLLHGTAGAGVGKQLSIKPRTRLVR